MKVHPVMFDAVALLEDISEQGLVKGQVGAIVMEYDEDNFEVEFVEKSGATLAVVTLNKKEFLVLHYEKEMA